MDAASNEGCGAVAPLKSLAAVDSARPPLVTTEKNNVVLANGKARTREIASRYKAGIIPAAAFPSTETAAALKRFPSPNAGRPLPAPGLSLPKRAQSVERRRPSATSTRPSTPSAPSSRTSSPFSKPSVPSSPSSWTCTPSSPSSRSTTPVRDSIVEAQKSCRPSVGGRDALWPSMRSLSSTFQSEPLSSVLTSNRVARYSSPDPPALWSTGSAASERKLTPLRGSNVSDQSENSRPVERMIDQHRWPGIGKVPAHALARSVDLTDKIHRSSSLSVTTRGLSPTRRIPLSGSAGSGLQKLTVEGARQLPSDGSKMLETIAAINLVARPPEISSSLTCSIRTQSLPVLGLHRPSSPRKALAISTSRAMQTSTHSRPSTPVSPSSSMATRTGFSSSVFNYIADVRTGKKCANHMEDAHLLRLLYNRHLQWRFVNAQADAAFTIQKITAEHTLYNVWNISSELRDSVIVKRLNVQKLKQDIMLNRVLEEQLEYLEEWTSLEKEHLSCLSGATEALKASTLRLPVTGGARADVRAVKKAVSSAVDVMQAMGSSICYLLDRVESTNRVVSELSNLVAKERAMLKECRELLASTSAMQVQDCSLRTHILQLDQDVV